MDCVVLIRMDNGNITALMEGDNIAVFPHMDDAIVATQKSALCNAKPWQIVECDEL